MGAVGAFLQIAVAQWDISAHILGIVETFFTPAHTVLYTGIGLVALANLWGQFLWYGKKVDPSYSRLLVGLKIAIFGSGIQIIAGPFDFWWHSQYGFDPFLFTPAHSLLIIGMVLGGLGMMIGSTRLVQAHKAGLQLNVSAKIRTGIGVLVLAAFWGQLNFAGYWATDLDGMAYTFGYCPKPQFEALLPCAFADQFSVVAFLVAAAIFAGSATIILWVSKSVFQRKGLITGIGAVLMSVYSLSFIGFTAYALEALNPPGTWYMTNPSSMLGTQLLMFIPFYAFAVIPVLLFDVLVNSPIGRRGLLGLSALVGPFAAFVDGRYAHGIAESGVIALGYEAVPMIVGSVLAGIFLTRVSLRLTPELAVPSRAHGPLEPCKEAEPY